MSYENLSPTQLTDFDNAIVLAHKANEAFDRRHSAAMELAKADGIDESLLGAIALTDDKFKKLTLAANVLFPPVVTAEAAEPTVPFAAETVWNAMTPEQQVTAAERRTAIAAGPLQEYGVTTETLRVVMAEVDGEKQFTLIHTGNGIDIGDPKQTYDTDRSYRSVMSKENDALFVVQLNGEKYDTRLGMTAAVYDAKFADAQDRGATLPDSKRLSDETGDDWTWTMLSGEPLTAGGDVPVRYVFGGVVGRYVAFPDDDNRVLRVCPAVVI